MDNTVRKITEYTFSSSANGMMMGSDESYCERLYTENGAPHLCVTEKKAFGPTTVSVYGAESDVFERLNALLGGADIASLSNLKEAPPQYIVYDYSSSSSISIKTETVGESVKREYFSLKPAALRQHGYEALLASVSALVRENIKPESLLEHTVKERENQPWKPYSVGASDGTELKEGEWRCSECNAVNPPSKFCPNCGSRRPE